MAKLEVVHKNPLIFTIDNFLSEDELKYGIRKSYRSLINWGIKNLQIVITDKKITSVQEFLPLLEQLAAAGKKDLVLIADDVEGEALATLVLNRLKGVFNTVAIKAPKFGDQRKDILE